jgi:hypothetical protein
MNGLVSFRLCKLPTPELLEKVDKLTDEMYQRQELPTRHIPARPDADYDLLVGELVQRMIEHEKFLNEIEETVFHAQGVDNLKMLTDLKAKIGTYLRNPYGTPQSAP